MTKNDLFFRNFGEGKPLVILHGILGSSDQWMGIGKSLSKSHKIIIPDLPNHGQSFHINALDYKTISGLVYDFLKKESINKYILLGHSWGGKIAMQMALDYPESIEKLIIADISPKAYPLFKEHKDWIELVKRLDLNVLDNFKDAMNAISLYLHDEEQAALFLKNLVRKGKHLQWRSNMEYITKHFFETQKNIEIHHPIKIPTLLLCAEHSDYISSTDIFEMQKYCTNLQIKVVPNSTHWIHATNPKDFLNFVLEFIQIVREADE